jgi:hypothetical protein
MRHERVLTQVQVVTPYRSTDTYTATGRAVCIRAGSLISSDQPVFLKYGNTNIACRLKIPCGRSQHLHGCTTNEILAFFGFFVRIGLTPPAPPTTMLCPCCRCGGTRHGPSFCSILLMVCRQTHARAHTPQETKALKQEY